MIQSRTLILNEGNARPIPIDFIWSKHPEPKGLVVFLHGYKGFKDWGCWNLVAKEFALAGYVFVKFNFSHNGTSIDNQQAFVDLEGFGKNTYSRERTECIQVIRYLESLQDPELPDIRKLSKTIIGHSRGGGIALSAALELRNVAQVITWSGVSDFFNRFPYGAALQEWKDNGVYYVENKRTGQKLPHYFSWYEDFLHNEKLLDIRRSVMRLNRPSLHIHAADDEAVHPTEAFRMSKWNPLSKLVVMPSGGHTFGTSHPWDGEEMPEPLKNAVFHSLKFLSEN